MAAGRRFEVDNFDFSSQIRSPFTQYASAQQISSNSDDSRLSYGVKAIFVMRVICVIILLPTKTRVNRTILRGYIMAKIDFQYDGRPLL